MNMKKLSIILFSAVALIGCDSLKYSYPGDDNRIFILSDNLVQEHLVKLSDSTASATLSLGIAQPLSRDVKAEMAAAPELFERYREVYHDTDINLMPSDNYEVRTPQIVIPAGNVKSVPVEVDFKGLDTLNMDMRYVIPVTVKSAENIDILESARTMYYTFKGASLINVVADLNKNRAWPEWRNPETFKSMDRFTLEALVYPNEFSKQISTIMGIEGKFLVRAGDANLDSDQIQIATSAGNLTSSSLKLQTGRWTHIAVVYDYGTVYVYLDGKENSPALCTSPAESISVWNTPMRLTESHDASGSDIHTMTTDSSMEDFPKSASGTGHCPPVKSARRTISTW